MVNDTNFYGTMKRVGDMLVLQPTPSEYNSVILPIGTWEWFNTLSREARLSELEGILRYGCLFILVAGERKSTVYDIRKMIEELRA